MKKIHENVNQKDRIVCVKVPDRLEFYYQAARSRERIWLFTMAEYSASVYCLFQKHGRKMDGVYFSLTIQEMYALQNYRNVKLGKFLDRLPMMIDFVLRELREDREAERFRSSRTAEYSHDDDEREYIA